MTFIRKWYPQLVFVLAVVILFHRLLAGEVLYWGVVSIQFYPWRDVAYEQLRHGLLPFWNPHVGNGAPLLANLQTAVFYPPNLLYLLLPTEYANGFVAVAHVFWAGLGMWLYLGRLQLDKLARSVGMLSFSLGGYLIARLGFLTMTSAVPWLPWVFWAVDGLMLAEVRQLRRYAALLGLFVGLQLLAGHAQTSFYTLVFAGMYALWLLVRLKSPPLRLLVAGGGVMLGVALSAVQLFPTSELVALSPRSAGAAMEEALAYSFWPWRILTIIVPGAFGTSGQGNYWGYATYWEDALYIGLLPIMSAFYLLLRKRHPDVIAMRHIPFFAFIIVPVTLLALGRFTPVFPWLFENVPTFDLFRGPTRWMLIAVFSLTVLGSAGLHQWHTTRRMLNWSGRIITVGLAVIISTIAASVLVAFDVELTFITAFTRFGVLLVIIGALLPYSRWLKRKNIPKNILSASVLTILAIDLVTVYWLANPTISASFYEHDVLVEPAVNQATQDGRIVYLPEDEAYIKFEQLFLFADYRADDQAHWDALRESLLPNIARLADLLSANNDDPLTVGYHTDLINQAAQADTIDTLEKMNVSVLLTAEARSDLDYLGQAGLSTAYALPDPWFRVELADCQPHPTFGYDCQRVPTGSTEIVTDTALQIDVSVTATEETWLVLIDTYYPGWTATVNGDPAAVVRANQAFRAVYIPAGESIVSFRYQSTNFTTGLTLSGLSLGLLIVLVMGKPNGANNE